MCTFTVGVPEIDGDHELVWGILHRLNNAAGRAILTPQSPTWVALRAFFDAHCENEEELMRNVGYADGGRHATAHEDFNKDLDAIAVALERDPSRGREAAATVQAWLEAHAREFDAALARFIKGRDAHNPPPTSETP